MGAQPNVVVFGGYLGADAEQRFTPNGVEVISFSVGNSESFNDSSGKRQKRTVWMKVNAWNGVGKGILDYLVKGKEVCVTGKLVDDSYEKDGVKVNLRSIRAVEIKLGDGPRNEEEASEEKRVDFQELAGRASKPANKPAAKPAARKPAPAVEETEDGEDDPWN